MNKRENLLSLLQRKGYDFVPVEFSLTPAMVEKYKKSTGSNLPYQEYFGFSWKGIEDIRLPEYDVRKYEKYFNPPLASGAKIDMWGVGHEFSPNSMHMTYMRNPMRNMENLEELMMDMMLDDEKAHYILDAVTEIAVLRAQAFARAGADILYLGDDIGMQSTPMMSEELYCTWLKPRLAQVIKSAKAIHPEIIIFYHSCGYVESFIPHLIEAGVEVLNPIQSESMDFAAIHKKYADQLSFHGTIGTQTVMPFGTPAEVKQAVWKNLDIAGEKGGLYVAPTHILEPEVPWENVEAYVQACREYC